MKKLVGLVAIFVLGAALGAGITARNDHPAWSVLQGEAMSIALAATAKAHSMHEVPSAKNFMSIGERAFPPSYGNVGLDAGQTYGKGTNEFAFIFGKVPQTFVCVTLPVTLGQLPQLVACP